MTRTCRLFTFLAVLLLAGSVGWAQSNGNFSAAGSGTACLINTSNGQLSGGAGCLETFTTSTGDVTNCLVFNPTIKTSNGNGVTLLVTPSAVTGLFTETKTLESTTSSTAEIGINVCVEASGTAVLPDTGNGAGKSCVIYDERFQQVSTNFFGLISGCSTNASCEFELILSTLSAHSFNFIVKDPTNKPQTIDVGWSIVNINTAGNATVGACVGPADVTVVQTQLFQNSGTLSF